MHKYRKPTTKHHKPELLDGFVSNTGNLELPQIPVKKRFNSHYQPRQHAEPVSRRRDIGRIATQSDEGFHSRVGNIESTFKGTDSSAHAENTLDLSLSEDVYRPPGLLGKRHGHGKQRTSKKGRIKKVLKGMAIATTALVIAVSSLFAYGYIKTRQIFRGDGEGAAALKKNVEPSKLNGEGDGRVNVLLLGKGGEGHTAPDLTDTLLLASIDPVQNEAALLSVPRDLYVKDDNGSSTKINAIYANAKQSALARNISEDQAEDAGLSAIKDMVGEVLGVPIHYYVMIDFKAFENAIDTVGGISFEVKEELYDPTMAWLNNGNPVLAEAGMQTFNGYKALMYARSRYTSSDFDRSRRQREIIVALKQKALSTGTLSNPLKLKGLVDSFSENVRTDLNGEKELSRLLEIGNNISGDRILSVGLTDDPVLVTTDSAEGLSVVRPVAGFNQYDEIHDFVRNTLRDAFLKLENSRIVILNGTTQSGLATLKQKELKSYGYNIVNVDNAPTTDYTQTRLIQLNGEHKYTESYLSRRLGVSSEKTTIEGLPTSETADFVIILGSNEVNKASSN